MGLYKVFTLLRITQMADDIGIDHVFSFTSKLIICYVVFVYSVATSAYLVFETMLSWKCSTLLSYLYN